MKYSNIKNERTFTEDVAWLLTWVIVLVMIFLIAWVSYDKFFSPEPQKKISRWNEYAEPCPIHKYPDDPYGWGYCLMGEDGKWE